MATRESMFPSAGNDMSRRGLWGICWTSTCRNEEMSLPTMNRWSSQHDHFLREDVSVAFTTSEVFACDDRRGRGLIRNYG